MQPSFKVESGYQQLFRKYIETTSRAAHVAINTKLLYVASGAARHTPKTDRGRIERELGVTAYRLVYNTRGKNPISTARSMKQSSANAITGNASLVHKIINARRGRAGLKGLYGHEMKEAVRSVFTKRFRSVGTLKAGWTHAIRKIGKVLGISFKNAGASASVKGKSSAVLAKPGGLNPSGSVTYNVNAFSKDHQPYIHKMVKVALATAWREEMRSMKQYLIDKLQPKQIGAGHNQDNLEKIQRMMRP